MWYALALLSLNPEIEVPSTVAPLSRLLPELGQRANMRLVAGASVREDVVGIASPKRPVRATFAGTLFCLPGKGAAVRASER